jgi:hypothetical protein
MAQIPVIFVSKQAQYIFWHQGCQIHNYDVKVFVLGDDNWSCSWLGVGAQDHSLGHGLQNNLVPRNLLIYKPLY